MRRLLNLWLLWYSVRGTTLSFRHLWISIECLGLCTGSKPIFSFLESFGGWHRYRISDCIAEVMCWEIILAVLKLISGLSLINSLSPSFVIYYLWKYKICHIAKRKCYNIYNSTKYTKYCPKNHS